MGEERRPDKQQVIDALVTAFAYSRAAKLVGTDALRSVITVEYHDIVRDGVFDLQSVWELLEGQPGFEPDAVSAPLSVFKSWQDKLGLEVKLPAAMASLSDKEMALAASQCKVPPAEVKALFATKEESARVKQLAQETARNKVLAQTSGRNKALPPAEDAAAKKKPPKERPRWLGYVAGAVGAIALTYAGVTLYRGCNPPLPAWEAAQIDDLKKHLPGAAGAKRLGTQLTVTVADNAWFGRPEEERRVQLRDSLQSMIDRGVRVLIVRDGSGALRATAQQGRDGQIHVTFKK